MEWELPRNPMVCKETHRIAKVATEPAIRPPAAEKQITVDYESSNEDFLSCNAMTLLLIRLLFTKPIRHCILLPFIAKYYVRSGNSLVVSRFMVIVGPNKQNARFFFPFINPFDSMLLRGSLLLALNQSFVQNKRGMIYN